MIGPLCYVGGKNRLAKHIVSLLPPHHTYVEPFAGGAQVLFHKEPSAVEVLNDLNDEIPNLFRVIQSHEQEFVRYTHFLLASRKWFELLEKTPPETLTDIQRAARFYFLQKNAFGGLVVKRNYKAHIVSNPNFNPLRVPEIIEQAHQRLARVQIECLPYQEILRKFDSSNSLFYLDPPYYSRYLYRFNFEHRDFEELAACLSNLKGKFLLSLNDVPEVRKIFSGFRIEGVQLAYSAQKKAGNRYKELLIRNF